MPIDNSVATAMRLAIDRTRQCSVSGPELASAHRNVGRLLAADIATQLPVEECSIEHTTGLRTDGVRLANVTQIAIVPLMRAGLFVAEGIWELLPGAALIPWFPNSTLPKFPSDTTVILVDAVINSGNSMQSAIDILQEKGTQNIIVASLVGYMPTLKAMAKKHSDVPFVTGRASGRSYSGFGGTDTGGRLFGTTSWETKEE